MKKQFKDLKKGDKIYLVNEDGTVTIEEFNYYECCTLNPQNYVNLYTGKKRRGYGIYLDTSIAEPKTHPDRKLFVNKYDAVRELKKRQAKINNSLIYINQL